MPQTETEYYVVGEKQRYTFQQVIENKLPQHLRIK